MLCYTQHMSTPPQAGAANATDRAAQANPPIRRVWVFMIVALALLMMSVDSTIVATALHTLQRGLDTTINWAGWTLTAYAFGFVLMLPISGKLSERYGRRRVFVGSVVVFTAASALCGLADNIFVLIALRVLQAAGGAGFTPSATGIIVDRFGDARDRAVSLFGSIFPIGAMIGPIFGGLFVSYWSWRAVFFVNVPIGLAIIVLALRFIPPDAPRPRAALQGMDFVGAALLGSGLLAGMLAINALGTKDGPVEGWPPAAGVPLALLALLAIGLFLRHVRRTAQPFIEPRLIHGPGFGVVNLVNAIYGGITIGAIALVPLYATNRYGISALAAGTLLMAQGLAAIALSLSAALALRRTGYRLPIYLGGSIIAVGLLLLASGPMGGVDPYPWLTGSAFLVGVGTGMVNPASRNAGLQLAPQHSSVLAALRTLSLQIGTILTVSVTTAILAGAPDAGATQAWVYALAALVLLAALPLIRHVPEHRGAW